MELQILVRGQSNAILMVESGRWAAGGLLAGEVQRLLGFDGVTDKVSILYARGDDQGGTAHGASAFLGDWMQRGPDGAWQPGPKELGLLRTAAALDSPNAASTAVLWLHSEYDSFNANLNPADWMAAVRQDAALLRGALGGDADSVPYHFVSAHPFGNASPQGHQAIRAGMEALAADPSFHARIAARALDIDASLDEVNGDYATVDYGGPHFTLEDGLMVAARAARTIAEEWSDYSKPGSPVWLAGGDIADTGPRVVAAQRTGPDTLRLLVEQDGATGFAPLDPDAASGLGWAVTSPGAPYVAARSATVLGPDTVELAFNGPLPEAGGVLQYGWGNGRLAAGGTGPGQYNAIYDNTGLPIWTPVEGVTVGAAPAFSDALWLR